MMTRLLLMTNASPCWANLFLADVKASGVPVARLESSAAKLEGCTTAIAEWYASLEVVVTPAEDDVVVWLAESPRAMGRTPVLSVGGLASKRAGLREVARGEGVSVVELILHNAAGETVLDTRGISTQRRWNSNRELMRDHAEVMLRDSIVPFVQNPMAARRVMVEAPAQDVGLAGFVDILLYGLYRYPGVVLDKIIAVGAKILKIPRGVWTLCLVETGGQEIRFTPLPKPHGVVRADPFVAAFEGRDWLFFEEYSVLEPNPKGVLKCAPLQPDGHHGDVLPFMERPYHLSYPQILEDNGRMFMLPEAHAGRRLDLLACRTEQGRPVVDDVPVQVLMEKASVADATFWVDPVTHERWLFASLSRTRRVDHAVELHAFKLGGESGWALQPHPMNPIVRDCRYARCAGKMYKDDAGRLIRPCQAHVGNVYGAEVHLMEITELTEERYTERRVGGFAPTLAPGFDGLHHVCRLSENRFLVDARRSWELKR